MRYGEIAYMDLRGRQRFEKRTNTFAGDRGQSRPCTRLGIGQYIQNVVFVLFVTFIFKGILLLCRRPLT